MRLRPVYPVRPLVAPLWLSAVCSLGPTESQLQRLQPQKQEGGKKKKKPDEQMKPEGYIQEKM